MIVTDPNREKILQTVTTRFGKTIARVAADTGINSRIVRSRLRELERGGLVESKMNAMRRREYRLIKEN